MSYIVAHNRIWCADLADILQKSLKKDFLSISNKKDLSDANIKKINPKYIFFAHWSHFIPKAIYDNYTCVIFHMTDLPFGRGGSPLQNLIVRGHKETKLSAIKCVGEIDAGPIYMKKRMKLNGSAEEIYFRATDLTREMIEFIVENEPDPVAQKGKVTKFKRRNREDGNLENCESLDEIYNYIRMLDAEGYPRSFIRYKNFELKFSKASLNKNILNAKVEIIKNNEK
jgi:methionyl-tRNA formyltransferase